MAGSASSTSRASRRGRSTSDALRPRRCATSPGCCAASITPPAPPNGGRRHFDAETWLAEARAAFIGAYGGIGPAATGLLEAFELEKACYEVRYEASNRPDWLWLPLAAVERLSIGSGRACRWAGYPSLVSASGARPHDGGRDELNQAWR